MRLYLVQHGKAASKEVDPARPLTKEGAAELQAVAKFISNKRLCVSNIWHSGKRRAVETAEILAEAVKSEEGVSFHEGLSPNDDVSLLRDELGTMKGDVMIVGHLPFLGKLASLLLAGSEEAGVVSFINGGVVCLERKEAGGWQIEWVVTPEIV